MTDIREAKQSNSTVLQKEFIRFQRLRLRKRFKPIVACLSDFNTFPSFYQYEAVNINNNLYSESIVEKL